MFFALFSGRREFMSLKIVAISIMNGNGKSSCELPFKVLRFVAFIYYHWVLFLASFFNFPHLILQCGSGGSENTKKQTREGENEAFEKCGKIAFHLSFFFHSRLQVFKEQGGEIDCRCETFNWVVAARVVITCLNRHILCFHKSFLLLMSREIREEDKNKVWKAFETVNVSKEETAAVVWLFDLCLDSLKKGEKRERKQF